MPNWHEEMRQTLCGKDPEFRKLAEEHSRCESQLESLLTQEYHSADDFIQEAILKKQKLHLKDLMEMVLARRQHEQALR